MAHREYWAEITLLLCGMFWIQPCKAGQRLTVVDEIGLSHFGDPYTLQADAIEFSPDGRYFAVNTERGRLDLNRPESTVRIYDAQHVKNWLSRPTDSANSLAVWTFSRSTDRDGPVITHWRWLEDSSGIAFLERSHNGGGRLVLADLRSRTVSALTPEEQTVKAFAIRDREHYVYAVANPAFLELAMQEQESAFVVGTGRSLPDLLFPIDQHAMKATWADSSTLWAVLGGKRFQVEQHGNPVLLFDKGQESMTLSPDGRSLVTALPVKEIPSEWVNLYTPPFPTSPYRLKAGRQDLATFMGYLLVSRYVLIELQTGSVRDLGDGPTSDSAGWLSAFGSAAWSSDGQNVLLPSAFLNAGGQAPIRPCVAVLRLSSGARSCVEMLKAQTQDGYEEIHLIVATHFVGNDDDRVVVIYNNNIDTTRGSTEYKRGDDGTWYIIKQTTGDTEISNADIDVRVKQGLNDPPVLLAIDRQTDRSRVLWDPNPQLQQIDLGRATVYKWTDKTGRNWVGGLYRPPSYEPGHRYPLVIQTHGFIDMQFRPSGLFPTALAARSLAAAGIVVLQVPLCQIFDSPEEVSCNLSGYEAAVAQLSSDGLVDSNKVGIVGFSRTCLHVMAALTTSPLRFEAASITDGVMEDYFQYLASVDMNENIGAKSLDAIIGGQPFGPGLQQWVDKASIFGMDRVNAPLLIVGEGPSKSAPNVGSICGLTLSAQTRRFDHASPSGHSHLDESQRPPHFPRWNRGLVSILATGI